MPFGLKNTPQIFQRLNDNALYGYLKIGTVSEKAQNERMEPIDVFTEVKPETDHRPSVLGRYQKSKEPRINPIEA